MSVWREPKRRKLEGLGLSLIPPYGSKKLVDAEEAVSIPDRGSLFICTTLPLRVYCPPKEIDMDSLTALFFLVGSLAIVTIAADGKATMKSKLDTMLAKGVAATVDFNPVADRLRVMGADGMNLRANVDDGKVTKDGTHKYADGDMHKGEKPNIVAGAYTNSVKGTKETALYDIDWSTGSLLKQAPPNDGILNTVGPIGMKLDGAAAFDIATDAAGKNWAWMMAGKTLYSVDLATGAAKASGDVAGVTGKVLDIAVLPSM
ncbi:MAG: DUF4394 domain-containing protein [Sphingomonadales bacterium]|nr:DUF4394 domain-containing protein [Sphingomonadales bacterium]